MPATKGIRAVPLNQAEAVPRIEMHSRKAMGTTTVIRPLREAIRLMPCRMPERMPISLLRHGDEHGKGGAEIDGAGGEASPEDGEGEVALGVLNFVAHDRGEVEADERVTDGAEGSDEPPVGDGLVQLREVEGAAVMRGGDVGEVADHRAAGDGARAAEVVDPFTERQAADIQQHEEDDDADGDASGEDVAVFEALDAGATDVEADSDAGEDDGGQIEDVGEPVAPAGEEAVLFAEAALGPEIDAAFAGPFLGEFGDGCALRPEEAAEGDDPEPDGDGAGGRDRRDHVEVRDRDDEQQHQVFAAEDALEAGLVSECDGFAQISSARLVEVARCWPLFDSNSKSARVWLCGFIC